MPSKRLKNEPTWRLALRFGIVFIVVVILIQTIWEFVSSGNLKAIPQSFENGQWIEYIISKLVIGTVYGFTMAYFTKKQA